jgi:hypothetical protein
MPRQWPVGQSLQAYTQPVVAALNSRVARIKSFMKRLLFTYTLLLTSSWGTCSGCDLPAAHRQCHGNSRPHLQGDAAPDTGKAQHT